MVLRGLDHVEGDLRREISGIGVEFIPFHPQISGGLLRIVDILKSEDTLGALRRALLHGDGVEFLAVLRRHVGDVGEDLADIILNNTGGVDLLAGRPVAVTIKCKISKMNSKICIYSYCYMEV